jgi:ribulose-phosphate 3-epimerase
VIELAFSILASDFAHLADEVAAAERGGGSIVHVDVMDGHFVPNITFGPPMVKALRPITKLPLDCHLMIEPATPVETLVEVLPMVHYVLVMSVNPGFGGQEFLPLAVEKIAHLAELREALGLNFRIEVDGGIAHDTVASVVKAGAEMLVAGSAVFESGRTEQNAVELLRIARAAAPKD